MLLVSCMDYGPAEEENFSLSGKGFFIINEGNFMYGNASLSYYNPDHKSVENQVFYRSNGIQLGDVAQSGVIYGENLYLVVNNSGVIFVCDKNTLKMKGLIKGLTSPRYIHFFSDSKAYVTDLYADAISIVNPLNFEVTGSIKTGCSTEQMVQYGSLLFVNSWSNNNKILVIDIATDSIIDEIEVGIQPVSMVIDCNNKLWVTIGGGYEGSSYGYGNPALYKIDVLSRKVEKIYQFEIGDCPSRIVLNRAKDTLYLLKESVWKMNVSAEWFPSDPFIENKGTIFYGLAIDPLSSEIYVADAIDYVQSGVVYRFSSQGKVKDTIRVGIIPSEIILKEN